jgi:Leucine-rich repeat (LRR) protein
LVDNPGFTWRHVQQLRLTNNQIFNFEIGTFIKCTNVEDIYLDNNQLTTVDFNEFRHNSKLKSLDMSFNNITKILDSTTSNITILKIHNNDLGDIMELCKLQKLKELNLSRNRRINFSNMMFNCWSELAILFLTDTNLKRLDHNYQMLTGCNKLAYLNLMDNDLEVLCFERFPDLPLLIQLTIRNNSLSQLDVVGLKTRFRDLQKITTTANKWSCDYLQHNLEPALKAFNINETNDSGSKNEDQCMKDAAKKRDSILISFFVWVLILLQIVFLATVFFTDLVFSRLYQLL